MRDSKRTKSNFFPKDLVEGLLLKALGLTHLVFHLQESSSGFKHVKSPAQALALVTVLHRL